jgi:polyhydroxyalkanoate synthesis regulator phasin
MADAKDPMNEMFKFWQSGQDAFFNAQQDLADGFAKSMTQNITPKPTNMMPQGFDAWQGFVKAWAPSWDPATAMATGATDMFNKSRDAMFSLFDPSTWMAQSPEQLKTILQGIANAPQFADLVMPQGDMATAWKETMDFQEATADFAKLMHEAWARSYAEYSKAFTMDDLKSGKVKEALDAWLKIANKELLDTQAGQEFMDAQKKLMTTATRLKKRQAEAAQKWAEIYQMPTRTEIDDLTKTVTELRRELRELKRKIG